MHVPFEHVSFTVHASSSSQRFPDSRVVVHPTAGSQDGARHTLGVPQSTARPGVQSPSEQVSLVQKFPVSHGAPFAGVWRHPVVASQESAVQSFPSSQLTGLPVHAPATQISPVVQRLPSSHGPLNGGKLHPPLIGSHRSRVHGFPS